ncbi:YueI family protein [Alkaliphilus hydrothermalis]|uniref:Uncharacterized protein YueI n=1 Tax=Alkaliphilus hydrothermalis TaxID=1482730 RepID=A0ABS2NQC4_9FIRM|nr:YueI family protein [Alkaliphilus hydrothermalis]MBM7615133.1 uncharacterized protein YueI [Alkaliphilus hydrothermalis]
MPENDDLKRVLDYALHGTPQLKADEKRKWLGEFRERVLMGITFQQALEDEAIRYVENALKDPMGEILIVNNRIPMKIMTKYMQLAKRMNKEYKTMATNCIEAMGVVVVNRRAINRNDVVPEIKMLPEKFRHLHHKSLCSKHFKELEETAPEYIEGYNQISFGDRMMGIKCAVCQKIEDGGPLM